MANESLEACCRILVDTEGLPELVRALAQQLLQDSESEERTLHLAYSLYQCFAYNACRTVLDCRTPETHEFQIVKQILLGASLVAEGETVAAQECLPSLDDVHFEAKWVKETINEIYQSANTAFNDDKHEKARRLYNTALPYDPRVSDINKGTLGQKVEWGAHFDADVEHLRQRVEKSLEDGVAKDALPAMAQAVNQLKHEQTESLKGKKLLLVMREHCWGFESRIWEPRENFRITTAALGLDIHFFNIDAIVFGGEAAAPERLEVLKRLSLEIERIQPDLVVVDNLGMDVYHGPNNSSFPHLFADVLKQLKSRFNFRLIGMYADAWEPECVDALKFVTPFVDCMWYLSYSAYWQLDEVGQSKSVVMPFPHASREGERIPFEERTIEAAFLGTSKRYNAMRSLWFLSMEDADISFELLLTDPVERPNRLKLSDEEYAQRLASMKTCIHFSGRNLRTKILCGRVWEALLAGCALVEEENIETKQLLVPYLHYIPFSSTRELAVATAMLKQYPALRESLSIEGQNWAQELLTPTNIWTMVLA
jgi:hypothetical protein